MTAFQALHPLVPQRYKNSVKHVVALANRIAGGEHMAPSFLIIGAQKAGTSSLFKYLMRHGGYLRPLLKDIYYFDNNHRRSKDWYLSFFPSMETRRRQELVTGSPIVTGEGATYYLLHPLAPQRVRAAFPEMKLVVLLRDPVERALSHYFHNRRFGSEAANDPLEAFELEERRLAGEQERLERDPAYRSHAFQTYSYLARGCYAEQLARWISVFPREQLHIECSEHFYAETDRSFRAICRFLELPERSLEAYDVEGRGGNRAENEQARAFAREHFRRPNQDLFDLLGERLPWQA